MDNRNTLTLPQLIQRVLRTASLTLGGHRALHLDAKDYYRLLELADAAGAIEPAPPAQAPAPGREDLQRLVSEIQDYWKNHDLSTAGQRINMGALLDALQKMVNSMAGSEGTGPEAARECWVLASRHGMLTTAVRFTDPIGPEQMPNGWRWVRMVEAAPASVSGPHANRTNPNPQNPAPRGEKETP